MNTKKLFQQVFLHTAFYSSSRVAAIRATSRRAAVVSLIPKTTLSTRRQLTTSSPCRNGNMMQDKKCWACQSTNKPSALFCENKVCSVIQPIPASLNFYHLLQVGTGENK